MNRVCVVCEGQTEETFVRDVLAPAFVPLNLFLSGETIETSTSHKGGALSYPRVQRHVRNLLRQRNQPIVTTLFDLYRLDPGFPGYRQAQSQTSLEQRLATLAEAFHQDIVAHTGCRPERFIPYIQPHEFEALLFSDVDTLVKLETEWARVGSRLAKVRSAAASPEHINDHPDTKPAKHLERELKNPSFRKKRHGPIAAAKIGLPRIEAECRFFAGWLGQLRGLAAPAHRP